MKWKYENIRRNEYMFKRIVYLGEGRRKRWSGAAESYSFCVTGCKVSKQIWENVNVSKIRLMLLFVLSYMFENFIQI